MDGSCTPQRRNRHRRLRSAALAGIALFACACNFAVTGLRDTADAGSTRPGNTPPADLATAHDLYTPMPDMTPLPENVGDACDGSCGAGLTCMSWVPNGYCSEACDSAGTVCPAGSTCVDTGGGARYCLMSPNGNGKCTRADLSCRDCGASVCGPSSFCDAC